MSTLLFLTFSVFKVGSILDFVQSGFVHFGILPNSGFCPIEILSNLVFRPFVILPNSRFCTIRDFVRFVILSNSRFCPFWNWSNLGFCTFGILSNSGFCPFGYSSVRILSIRDFVHFEFCLIRDFVQGSKIRTAG